MRNLLILVFVCCFASSAHSQQIATQSELEETAKGKVKLFATELKSALLSAIQKDSLHTALTVCKQRAPEIAESLSTGGWTVARTSLKTRNHNNQPDAWESRALNDFAERHKSGEQAATLTASSIDKEQFRFMQAIPTGQVCLACHGSSLDASLLKSIDALYPQDTAVGYTVEDIRGAFTLIYSQGINHEKS